MNKTSSEDKVSVNWQTLFWFLPVFNLFALYRIEKLRKGLLLIFAINIGISILAGVLTGLGDRAMEADYNVLSLYAYVGSLVMYGIGIGIGVHYIRKWSRQWNKKIDDEEGNYQ